jgi:hypothetical protein
VLSFGNRARVFHGHGRHGHPVHGGEHGEHGVGTKKGPKAWPCLQGYGARVLGCTLASVVARTGARAWTRTRRGRDAGAPTRRGGDERWRRPTARGERLGGWRARRRRRRHQQKMASQPGSKAGITSSGTTVRGRSASARRPRRPQGGEAASSPGWPLAEV